MKIAELVTEFSTRDLLPIDVNDVVECLRSNGAEEDIEFIGVELDPEILQGQIKIFEVRTGIYGAETTTMANIYYHKGHSVDWQRMICCKELIHLLDPMTARTSETDDIDELANRIGLPPEMQDPMNDGLATNVDRMAEFRALAILFPLRAREYLIDPYKRGLIKLADIARLADIPQRYIGLAMSDHWPIIHKRLTE